MSLLVFFFFKNLVVTTHPDRNKDTPPALRGVQVILHLISLSFLVLLLLIIVYYKEHIDPYVLAEYSQCIALLPGRRGGGRLWSWLSMVHELLTTPSMSSWF